VNIIAGKAVCREFIQDAAIPEEMAHQVFRLLNEERVRKACLDGLAQVRARLQDGADPEKAAAIVIEELGHVGDEQLGLPLA
jgi:lipid A disaccharide synthetase